MPVHAALLRTAGAAALALAGITLSTGAAHAATSISCSTGFAAGYATSAIVSGCGSYTNGAAPYTIFISQYAYLGFPINSFLSSNGETLDNVTITCQGFGPAGGSLPAGDYEATSCTNPFFETNGHLELCPPVAPMLGATGGHRRSWRRARRSA